MRYFFTIEKHGLDANGNMRHKIRGYEFNLTEEEYLIHNYKPMGKEEMADIAGRWFKDGKISNLEVSDILHSIFVAFANHEISYSVI